jgi:hypothetical protein
VKTRVLQNPQKNSQPDPKRLKLNENFPTTKVLRHPKADCRPNPKRRRSDGKIWGRVISR